MDKKTILQRIKDLGLLAVIRGPSEKLTLKLVDALVAGGITGIEITYSTPNAEEVARKVADTFKDDIVLGMGTLTELGQPEAAKSVGAQFIVSPMYEEFLVNEMVNSGLVSMAGALTPTEIFTVFNKGVDVVKVFPGSLGGPDYFKAIKGPFPQIPLMPTGGVSLENIPDWFAVGAFAVGAGSELCPKQLVLEEKFDQITARAKEFAAVVIEAKKK